MNAQLGDMKLEANIVEKPAFTVVGMRVRTKTGDPSIMQLWRDFDGQTERVQDGQTGPALEWENAALMGQSDLSGDIGGETLLAQWIVSDLSRENGSD